MVKKLLTVPILISTAKRRLTLPILTADRDIEIVNRQLANVLQGDLPFLAVLKKKTEKKIHETILKHQENTLLSIWNSVK